MLSCARQLQNLDVVCSDRKDEYDATTDLSDVILIIAIGTENLTTAKHGAYKQEMQHQQQQQCML